MTRDRRADATGLAARNHPAGNVVDLVVGGRRKYG
jgi:hypothetical protein